MNFNLISPSTNGNDYVINFKDPITINENSKVSLNWVELQRKGIIVLDDDATITFTCTNNLPAVKPSTGVANDIAIIVDIPKGKYELTEFQDLIQTKTDEKIAATPRLLNRYQAAEVENNNRSSGLNIQEDGKIGLVLKQINFQPFEIDTNNSHDAEFVDSGGDVVAYTTTNNAGAYDNYANSNTHFDFYRADCPEDQPFMNSYCIFQSIKKVNAQTGNIFFGLVGKEYTTGFNTPPTRTNGNNPPVLKDGVPACFLGIELGTGTGHIDILMAEDGGIPINDWTKQNKEITGMSSVFRVPVATTVNTSQPYQMLFGMQIDNTTSTPSLRWKVANYQNGEYKELYDSQPQRRNLPFKLLIGDGETYTTALARNSQIPFGFQVSAQNADNGFKLIDYAEIDKTGNGNSNGIPYTIIRDYQIDLSDNLQDILNIGGTGVITNLHPNGCQEACDLIESNLDVNWKSQNFSIFINLPTNNYKNVKQQRDGGFKKSILANIPAPFTTGAINTQQGSDNGVVVSTYQPYSPIISELKNNKITTNTMEIKIVDMLDERPAEVINRSIVNFTIHDSE